MFSSRKHNGEDLAQILSRNGLRHDVVRVDSAVAPDIESGVYRDNGVATKRANLLYQNVVDYVMDAAA